MLTIRQERDALLGIEAQYQQLQADYQRLDQEQTQDNIELEAVRFQYGELQVQTQQAREEKASGGDNELERQKRCRIAAISTEKKE